MKRYDKVILAVFVVVSVINLIDFIFYEQKVGYIALAIGFSLMAFGTYKDNNHSRLIGAVFAIGGFIAKWFFDYDLF